MQKSSVSKVGNSFLCVLVALIWGIAFVAQSNGGDVLGPYTFNCLRSILGGIVLIPVVFLMNSRSSIDTHNFKTLLTGGLLCGLLLCVATNLQQVALSLGASAGKAGFLTACYILLVPVFGLFLKKKSGWNLWIGVLIALAGLYLLCVQGSLSLQPADLLLLLCAAVFAVHILVVDYFAPKVNGVAMSCIQFLVCGILTSIPMYYSDMGHSFSQMKATLSALNTFYAWIPLLYTGILSSGVAYTLQIIAQKRTNPTVASLLFSLESVFSVLAGWILLSQALHLREFVGCILIFCAITLAQLPVNPRKNKTA